jgi:hypothetical protein
VRLTFERIDAGGKPRKAGAESALVGIGDRNAGPRDNHDLASTLSTGATSGS